MDTTESPGNMTGLYRLPNGNWITLTNVTLINTYGKGDQWNVLIEMRDNKGISLSFDDATRAVNFADELGIAVNTAKEAARKDRAESQPIEEIANTVTSRLNKIIDILTAIRYDE